ncbi:hypothetical protein PCE1_001693 [Barthelona sp. PCE]
MSKDTTSDNKRTYLSSDIPLSEREIEMQEKFLERADIEWDMSLSNMRKRTKIAFYPPARVFLYEGSSSNIIKHLDASKIVHPLLVYHLVERGIAYVEVMPEEDVLTLQETFCLVLQSPILKYYRNNDLAIDLLAFFSRMFKEGSTPKLLHSNRDSEIGFDIYHVSNHRNTSSMVMVSHNGSIPSPVTLYQLGFNIDKIFCFKNAGLLYSNAQFVHFDVQ